MGSCCSIADKESKAVAGGIPGEGVPAAIDRLMSFLEKWPFLLLSAASLVAAFVLSQGSWSSPAWFAVVVCGLPILREAFTALFVQNKIKTSLLISTAMVSCVAIGQIFAAGEVAFLMALGTSLEMMILRRAKKGLGKLVSLVPPSARKVITCPKCLAKGEKFRDVPLASLQPGDGVQVLPGETIPVDGIVTEGETTVDQSVMTGESLPVDKSVGDEVYSGTINRFGAITVKVTKADTDSSLQKLIRLVREAQARKAPVQRIADKWASRLVPLALFVALVTFIVMTFATGNVNVGLMRGVTVMVVFCPCSLALATPTAIMAAIGQATKYGVIVKSGEALELMGRVTAACLDKTGTLTSGRLKVSSVTAFGNGDSVGLLALAAAAEEASEHPLARAIVAEASSSIKELPGAGAFRMVPGRGVSADVDGKRVLCGTSRWLEEHGVVLSEDEERDSRKPRGEGKAVVYVAVDGRAAGFISLGDTVRDNAKEALDQLKTAGVEPCLLTGDHEETANAVAAELGIDVVKAALLPEGKAAAVEEFEAAGRVTCMVGDGVNDAPALKTASVGIAMGGAGSDIAVESADIALVGDDLTRLAYLKRLSTACVRLIHFNIAVSMFVNVCAIICSIFGILGPVSGAIVHNCTSVFVVVNAALLYDRKFTR